MRSLSAIGIACLVVLHIAAAPVHAQRDAGSKIRGDAYNVHSSSMYTRHARDHAHVLYDHARTRKSVPREVTAEHVAGVRTNIRAAQKELAKLKQEKAADKQVMKHVAALEASYAKCEEMCKMCDTEAGKDQPDLEVLAECCATMSHELDAAKAEHDKLMKTLGAQKMAEPKAKGAK